MTALRVEVRGTRETRIMVEGFGDRAAQARIAMVAVGDELRRVHATAYASAGANLPKPWRPLKASTAAAKRRRGWDRRVLIRRGDLRDSLTRRAHPRAISAADPGSLKFGTRSPVARLLRARGRNPVQVPADTRRITDILRRHLDGAGA